MYENKIQFQLAKCYNTVNDRATPDSGRGGKCEGAQGCRPLYTWNDPGAANTVRNSETMRPGLNVMPLHCATLWPNSRVHEARINVYKLGDNGPAHQPPVSRNFFALRFSCDKKNIILKNSVTRIVIPAV